MCRHELNSERILMTSSFLWQGFEPPPLEASPKHVILQLTFWTDDRRDAAVNRTGQIGDQHLQRSTSPTTLKTLFFYYAS